MMNALAKFAPAMAVAGLLLCVVSGVYRLLVASYVSGLEVLSFFIVGIGLMVSAVAVKTFSRS